MGGTSRPFRIRFRVPLTVIPLVSGGVVAAALWNRQADIEFFSAATHVLAIGAVGMALTVLPAGPLRRSRDRGDLRADQRARRPARRTGLGLFFSFHALANGHSETPDLAVTAGALASGIVAFGVQALFATPGMRDEEPEGSTAVPEPD
jgi:hypothetical protein